MLHLNLERPKQEIGSSKVVGRAEISYFFFHPIGVEELFYFPRSAKRPQLQIVISERKRQGSQKSPKSSGNLGLWSSIITVYDTLCLLLWQFVKLSRSSLSSLQVFNQVLVLLSLPLLLLLLSHFLTKSTHRTALAHLYYVYCVGPGCLLPHDRQLSVFVVASFPLVWRLRACPEGEEMPSFKWIEATNWGG